MRNVIDHKKGRDMTFAKSTYLLGWTQNRTYVVTEYLFTVTTVALPLRVNSQTTFTAVRGS